jgi:hypothetical protein
MPTPLTELSQLLPPPAHAPTPRGRARQFALIATSAGEHWQCPATRRTLRAQVGIALRWLRMHRHAEGWRLECWAQTPRGTKRLNEWSAQPNEVSQEHADSHRPFGWLGEAAARPGEFTVRGRRGLERSWPAPHLLRERRTT